VAITALVAPRWSIDGVRHGTGFMSMEDSGHDLQAPLVTKSSRSQRDMWSTTTIRNSDEFSAIAREWHDLHASCDNASPFQSHDWLASWWRAYGKSGRLFVVIVRRNGRLVFAAPLMSIRRLGYPVLVPVGGDLSDFTDFLIDRGHNQAVAAYAHALVAAAGGRPIDLFEVPPNAAACTIADAWPNRVWRGTGTTCFELPGRPIDHLVTALRGHASKRLRHNLRKIDQQDIRVTSPRSQDAERAIATLLRLHEMQWRGRGINPEHLRTRFAAHLTACIPPMIERGEAHLFAYERAHETLAVALLVIGKRLVGAYLSGIDPRLRDIDATALMLRENLALTARLDRPAYSMLRGTEPYKRQLAPRAVPNSRLLLSGTHPWSSAGYAAIVLGRIHTIRVVRARFPWALDLVRRARRGSAGVRGRRR
jgi:CelD/BcsL family acetyltransferase involved in cellulose biosynthesis